MGRAGATERTGQARRPFPHYGDTFHSLLHAQNLPTHSRNTKCQRGARQELSLEDAVLFPKTAKGRALTAAYSLGAETDQTTHKYRVVVSRPGQLNSSLSPALVLLPPPAPSPSRLQHLSTSQPPAHCSCFCPAPPTPVIIHRVAGRPVQNDNQTM